MNIAIIGAGLTGLTAAYKLTKQGHNVTIIEAGPAIGGLAGGFEFEGNNIEHAYHHVFKTDTDIIELIDELGVSGDLKWFESSMGMYYDKKLYPFMSPIDLLKFSPLSFISKMRLGVTVLFLQKTKKWQQFVKVTAAEWMERMCGTQAYNVVWKPLLSGKFHKYAEKISMAWLWARIHIRANSKDKGDTVEKLAYMKGGFHTFVEALGNAVKAQGATIELRQKVDGFTTNDDGTVTVEREGGEARTFDKVVFTTPTNVFEKMIEGKHDVSEQYMQQLQRVDYLGAALIVFSSDQSLNPYYWVSMTDADSPFLALIEHTNLAPKEWYNGKNVYYLATYVPHDHKYFAGTDDIIENDFFGYLKGMFPDFDESKIHTKEIIRLRNAQHIVDTDYQENLLPYKTPLKNVYLANFSQIFPEDRGMSYAVREGKKIAQIVSEDSSAASSEG